MSSSRPFPVSLPDQLFPSHTDVRTVSPVPHLNVGAIISSPFATRFSCFHHMTIIDATDGIGCNFGCTNKETPGLLDTTYLLYDTSPPFFNQIKKVVIT